MEIGNNSVISIHYRLTNDRQEEIASSAGRDPLIYMHGAGELVDGLVLHFEFNVDSVRPATDDKIETGQAL